MRLRDRFIKGSLPFLLLFTPFAFGSVHPWAYSLMEGVIAVMVFVWAVKIWSQRKAIAGLVTVRTWPYVLPLGLFVVYVLFQLVPLPPSVLQAISPSTYKVYTKALSGWPERAPYARLMGRDWERGRAGVSEAKAQHPAPNTEYPITNTNPAPNLSLSIAPLLTESDLLKFSSYALLFLLVVFYPAPGAIRDPERRVEYEIDFIRPLLFTILFAGFLVATVGFLNLFTWNGKVLWFFVPYDATGGGGGVRAAAPFIAPPSSANYLAMTLPLMLTATVSRSFLTPRRFGGALRVLCGFGVFIMFCGILLSLSRAGWASAALAIGVLTLLMILGRGANSWLARTPMRRLVTFGATAAALFLFVVVAFVGPRGQERLDLRLQETATESGTLQDRLEVWHDSVGMVRDFPVLGVGLGAWPDLFPRYQDSRLKGFYREAHNDYLELLAETGVTGVALLACFIIVCLTRISKSSFSLDPDVLPVVAALLAGMSAMAFHEIFDFNLQIPANAILFTVFLAIALRLSFLNGNGLKATSHRTTAEAPTPNTQHPIPNPQPPTPYFRSPVFRRLQALALTAIAILIFTKAFSQPMAPYPYYLRKRTTLENALSAIYLHPASAEAHTTLFNAAKADQDARWQMNELKAILWLAPGKTAVRDAYAARLLLQGRREEAWYEVTRSVAASPAVNDHFYMSPAVAPTLFPSEQEAIIFGFRKGIEDGYPGALSGLAEFYRRTRRFSDLVDLYAEAAGEAIDAGEQAEYFLGAADAAIKARQLVRAEGLLLEATRLKPDDTALLVKLIEQIYNARKDLGAAEKVVAEGIRNGADPVTLQISLAEAARSKGDSEIAAEALQRALTNGSNETKPAKQRYRSYVRLARVAASIGHDEVEEQALDKAIELQPNSYRALMQVAGFHGARKDYNKAAFYYRKATRANRASVDAYLGLARIEEAQFHFAAADNAYASAVRLAPEDEGVRKRYDAFKERVAKAKEGPGSRSLP